MCQQLSHQLARNQYSGESAQEDGSNLMTRKDELLKIKVGAHLVPSLQAVSHEI